LKRISKGTKAAVAVLVGLSLVAAACADDDDDTTTTTAATEETTTTAGGEETTTTTEGETTTTAAVSTESPVPTGGPLSQAVDGPDGGEVVVGADQEFTAYNNNQLDANALSNGIILTPVLPQLTYFDENGKLWLDENTVESVEITSEDPFTVTWTLNPKAVWSDGEPFDCDDLQAQWVAQRSTEEGYPFISASANGFEKMSSVTCPDSENVVVVEFAEPYGEWWGLFGSMMPAHILEQKGGLPADFDWNAAGQEGADLTELAATAEYWNTGWTIDKFDPATWLSAGPYGFDSVDPATNDIVLVKNDKYFGPAGKIDKITVRLTPDPTAAVQALANKEVQLIWPQPDADLIAQLDQLGDAVEYNVLDQYSYEHYDINFANELFQDEAVRQAFALCVPRQEIIDTLIKPVNEAAELQNSVYFYPFEEAYQDNMGDLAQQDIAKAKSTLEAAGWTLGSDGIYEKDGKKLEFKLARRDPQPRRQSTNELTINACKEAGFNLSEDAIPQAEFGARLGAGQWDVILFGWIGSPTKLSAKSIFVTDGGQNSGKYSNPEVDALLNEADKTTDPKALAEILNKADALILQDVATVPIFAFSGVGAWDPAIKGVAPSPTQAGDLWNVQTWTLES
jgi:peptide/nickel transport system substrate-binding protein